MKNTIVGAFVFALAVFLIPSKAQSYLSEPEIVLSPKEYAEQMITQKWNSNEWESFDMLIYRESKWNSEAKNSNSSAYGLGQFLTSTWGSVGYKKTSDPYLQIDATVEYVAQRYQTPSKALRHHSDHNWY
jgi:membrane-bound lytic murein transglycosylase MltF